MSSSITSPVCGCLAAVALALSASIAQAAPGAASTNNTRTLYQPTLKAGVPVLRTKAPVLSAPRPQPADNAPAQVPGGSAYRLRPLDPITVTLRGIPSPEEIQDQIDENGYINLPYIGPIKAEGKTTSELESLIEREYIDGQIYRRVSVNVVIPAQSYYVRGEVQKPGRYALISGVTIVQAVAAAGGYTDFANPKRAKIIRGEKTFYRNLRELEKAPEKDEAVEAGDVIVVPRSVF